jgi:tripeptide aminopeptidase
MPGFDRELEERLIRYAAIDTQSDEASATSPSTERQLVLSRLLVEELEGIGAADVRLTDYGVVLATIPATANQPVLT